MFNTSKAYNSIKTGLAERHLCRLWYYDYQDEDWRIDDFNRVQFAGALMTTAIKKVSATYAKVAIVHRLPFTEVKEDSRSLYIDM